MKIKKTKISNNQTGFSILNLLLILVIVGVIGGAGWYIWQSRKTVAVKDPSTVKNENEIKFDAIAIKLTVPDSIKDLDFKIYDYTNNKVILHDAAGKPIDMYAVNLSTYTLSNTGANCSAESSPLGIMYKVAGQYPKNPNSDNSIGKLVKQFNDFYISYSPNSDGGCNVTEQQTQALVNSLPSVWPIDLKQI